VRNLIGDGKAGEAQRIEPQDLAQFIKFARFVFINLQHRGRGAAGA
jgi:hypothetical protein